MVRHKITKLYWVDSGRVFSQRAKTKLSAPHLCAVFQRSHTWQKKRGLKDWQLETFRLAGERGHRVIQPGDMDDAKYKTVQRDWLEYAVVLSDDWLKIRRQVKECQSDKVAMCYIAKVLIDRWGADYADGEKVRRLHMSARGRLPSKRLARMGIRMALRGDIPTIKRKRKVCKVCGHPLEKPKRGNYPSYCGQACKQKAYRKRKGRKRNR